MSLQKFKKLSMTNYWQGKKVLVTGASGFTGVRLCLELHKKGARVRALAHKDVDLTNYNQTKQAITDETIIIHAACLDGGAAFKKKFAKKIFFDNLKMTQNLVRALENKNIEKFVYISSAEVYGKPVKKEKIKEEDLNNYPPFIPEYYYAWSKIINESLCQTLGNPVKVIIIRPANLYGIGDRYERGRLVPTILEKIKRGQRSLLLKGDGLQERTFLFVDDYVKNLLQLVEKSKGGIYNFAGEKIISIKDFVRIFSRISGLKITFSDKNQTPQPPFVLDITKAKKIVDYWYDSTYEENIKNLVKRTNSAKASLTP